MSNNVGSSTVDQRIVEMRIDNEKFEAGAKKTISILESLDRSLKGVGEENATGFDSIGKSLDKVTDRFSAMGIVGDQVMRNLTNQTMQLVSQLKNVATMLTTQQVGAGWNKYADKTQAIQTIMAATNKEIENGRFADQAEQLEWVNEQIEKLNKFTDETSYNFLDMVGNIGKFTAAGRELEESVTAMEGIANWAAISGGRPVEASRAMYNLSQALGMGKVTQLDWKSIENANMATYEFKQQVIDTAEELKTLRKISDGVWEDMEGHEVTVESFRENLKDGWFNSDVLLKVLNRYGEFSDVLLDISDRTGKTATEILSQIKAFKETGNVADWLAPYIETLTKDEYELGLRAFQAAQEAKTFQEAIDATKDAVSTKWMTVFELLFGNYLEAKELWTDMAETFWNIFAQPVDRLIEIIEGAKGIVGENGIFGLGGLFGDPNQTVGSTIVLEDRLKAIGKSMEDFRKALNKTMGAKVVKQIVDDYGSLEEALKNGAISLDQFKIALGAMDDEYGEAKMVGLDRALNKAGKTMDDFKKAVYSLSDRQTIDNIENYNSIKDAFRNGAISVDIFKKALESLGIDSENVATTVEGNVESATAKAAYSLEEMRKFALEVLRGDHGNGEERRAWYEAMGLDAELMQAMAGDLMWGGYNMSDEKLMEWMEQYYNFNNLKERLGYDTFAEYLASLQSAVEDNVYNMEDMAKEAEDIYASLFGEGVLSEMGEFRTAGDLFRESLKNLLTALDNIGTAFDKAFLRVFGGGGDYENQIGKMSDGFFTLSAAFWSFSNRVKAFTESESFLNFATAMLSVLRLIGKAIGFVFKIGKIVLNLALKLLSPILKLVTSLFEVISLSIDTMSRSLEDLGLTELIDAFGNDILDKIGKPIEKICKFIDELVSAFREGLGDENGGVAGGIQRVSEKLDELLKDHPVLLSVLNALGTAFGFVWNVVSGLAITLGSVFGGAVMIVIGVLSQLGEWFSQIVTWVTESELLAGIWSSITDALTKFGNAIKTVFDAAEEGYKNGGFIGALNSVLETFDKWISNLIPGGEAIVGIFQTIGNTIRNLFGKKNAADDPAGLDSVEETTNRVAEKVEAVSDGIVKLGELAENVGPAMTRAAEVVDTVADGMFGDEEQKESFQEKVSQFIQTLWAGILNGLSQIRISDVIGAMRLGLIASLITSVTGALTVFKDIGRKIKSIPETITEIGQRFAGMMQSLAATFTANAVLKFAVAAVLVGVALKIIEKIPQDTLTHAASVIIAVIAVMALLAKHLAKLNMAEFNKLSQLPNMAGLLFGLSMFVRSLALTFAVLAIIFALNPNAFWSVGAAIVILLGVVGAIAAGIINFSANHSPEELKAVGKMMLSIGASMILLGIAIRKLVIPLAILAVVKHLLPNDFMDSVKVLGVIFIGMALLIAILVSAAEHFNEKELLSIGHLFLRIAAAMVVVAFSIQMLMIPIAALAAVEKYIGVTALWDAVLAIGGIVAGLSILIGIYSGFLLKAGYSNMEQIGKTMLKIAASMLLAAAAMRLMTGPIIRMAKLCAEVDNWDILTGVLMLLGTVSAIGMLLTTFNKKSGINGGGGLIKVAGAITLIALAMLLLAPAVIGLTLAVAIFAGVLAMLDEKTWKAFAEGLWRLVKIAGAVFVFGAALFVLGAGIVAAGAGLVTVAGGIFLLVAALAVLMLTLPKFMEMLVQLKNEDMTDLWNSIRKVCLVMLLFALLIGRIMGGLNGLFKVFTPTRLTQMGSLFGTFINGLVGKAGTGVNNGFNKVTAYLQDPNNRRKILTALETMVVIGAGYVSGLIPTFSHVVINGIVTLVNSIASEIESQGGAIVDSLTRLAKAVVNLLMDAVSKLWGESSWEEMPMIKQGLSIAIGLGVGLIRTLLAVRTAAGAISFTNMLSSGNTAIQKVGELTSIVGDPSKQGSLYKAFNDAKGAVQLFIEQCGGLATVLPVAAALAAAFAYAAHGVKEQQKVLRENAGNPESLEEYAEAIETVQKRIDELTEQSKNGWGTELSEQELQAQTLLLKNLENEYAELQKQQEEATATANKEAYIKELQQMQATIDSMNGSAEKVGMQANYTKKLQEYASVLGMTTEELTALVTAQQETTVSATETSTAVAAASETVKEETEEAGSKWDQFVKNHIADSPFDDTGGLFDVTKPLESLKASVAERGLDINDFISTDGALNVEQLSSMINVDELKNSMLEKMKDAGSAIPEGTAEGIPGGYSYIDDAMGGMKDYSLSTFLTLFGINSPSKIFAEHGGAIPEGVALGMDGGRHYVSTSTGNMLRSMLDIINKSRESFYNSGRNIITGLVEGINSSMEYSYSAGQNLAASLETGFRERLLIESPSRVFENLAGYIPAGITQGIQDGQGGAIESIVVLGDALIEAIMQSMAMVSTVANDEFDLQPHITPVVDLSNVTSAAGAMGSAFSGNYRVSAQMSNAINSRMGDVERLANAMRSSQTVNQGDQITFNIYQQPGQNADELAEVVMQRMSTRFSRRGAAFG